MATQIAKKRRRQPGQACDSCHRKKTRCYWRSPACADCLRLSTPCTFDRNKASVPVETATLSEPVQRIPTTVEHGVDTSRQRSQPTGGPIPAEQGPGALAAIDVPRLIDLYFAGINHILPILSKASFHRWSNDDNDADPAYRTCLRSILSSALLHAQFSGSHFSKEQRQAQQACRNDAMADCSQVLLSPPSLHAVQVLASLAACSQGTEEGAGKSLPILAIAIRYAYKLNLHLLDEERGISVADRMERIRLFWCLYILDRSTSLKLHLPPMINDRDLNVISPKMWSDDGTGLIHSVNNSAELNLFTARQRLAVISGDIWRSLYTFAGERQPISSRESETARLQALLLDWKRDWFIVNHPDVKWPSSFLVSIALLQCEYFYCLLKSDPDTFPKVPKIIAMMPNDSSYVVNLQAKVHSGTAAWVDAARETLRLASLIRGGGFTYLQYASHYIVPATLVLSASIARGENTEQADSDRELTRLWRELFHHVADSIVAQELREAARSPN